MIKAVIDIGTNTIHLMIAEVNEDRRFKILKRESRFIRIARDGIAPISEESIERALYCLHDYTEYITQYEPESVEIIGTEALRSATNQQDITERIKDVTGYEVRIISGDEEAMYIYEGCMLAVPVIAGNFLIMDIGGGSVEFILADQHQLIWKRSYRIGVQYLFSQFRPSDLITDDEINNVSPFLQSELSELIEKIRQYPVSTLVGASGSFEIVAGLTNAGFFDKRYAVLDISEFTYTCEHWIYTTLEQRLNNGKINPDRAELMVMGLLLMKIVHELVRPEHILVSNYALREGVLTEINSIA